jgi:hypothetical protein
MRSSCYRGSPAEREWRPRIATQTIRQKKKARRFSDAPESCFDRAELDGDRT